MLRAATACENADAIYLCALVFLVALLVFTVLIVRPSGPRIGTRSQSSSVRGLLALIHFLIFETIRATTRVPTPVPIAAGILLRASFVRCTTRSNCGITRPIVFGSCRASATRIRRDTRATSGCRSRNACSSLRCCGDRREQSTRTSSWGASRNSLIAPLYAVAISADLCIAKGIDAG